MYEEKKYWQYILLTHSREFLICCLAFATSLARDDPAATEGDPL